MVFPGQAEKLRAFNEWAHDKSSLMAMASLLIAGSAEDCLKYMEMLKVGKRIEGYHRLPPIKQWLKLYRRHRQIHKIVADCFRELDDELAEIVDFYELVMKSFREVGKLSHEDIEKEIKNTPREILREMSNTLQEYEELFKKSMMDDDSGKGKTLDEREWKRIRRIFQKPEMIFFYRVWTPCFLLYGTFPTYLLRKARHGDEDAIEKLLRLDKSIIDDPKIKEIFHQAAAAEQRGEMDLMTKALAKSPKAKIDIQTVKYTLAGLISIISIALGQKITAAEIHRLFDALAVDAGKGAIDEDLIVSPETFEKAIQRTRTFWRIPRLADKK